MKLLDKALGISTLKTNYADLKEVNKGLIEKTQKLNNENHKMNSFITSMGYQIEAFTGETNHGDLPQVKELVIVYEFLRLRSWEFILKNHIANLIVTKRINWQIGSGLLFNSKPSEKPFIEFYGNEKGKLEHKNFITEVEYQYRNFEKSKEVDYTGQNNLHEMARNVDYNACGDGDVLLLMRVKDGFPNIQVISGQCLENPFQTEITKGHTMNEGVELNAKGEVVAYHITVNTETSNTAYKNPGEGFEYGTKRVPVYFKGTKFKQAWLYRATDLRKLGETRSMPLLSDKFESLQHVNDYIIANAKNAQLKAQMVIAFEKDANSDGTKIFNDANIDIAGMNSATENTTQVASDTEVHQSAVSTQMKMEGNAIVFDAPRGVKAKMINDTAQSDQKEYLNSVLTTIFADTGYSMEFMLSTYNSNYSASMGARSDTQHTLDVTTEIIPSAQLYKMHYEMFLYLQVMKGDIKCEPLKKAYQNNDVITIQAICNSTFEGTKLKPIDPVKFIKSLRDQMPESIRDKVALNSLDNLVNSSSGGDFETTTNQVGNEINAIPESFGIPTPEPNTSAKDAKIAMFEDFKTGYEDTMGDLPDEVENFITEFIDL